MAYIPAQPGNSSSATGTEEVIKVQWVPKGYDIGSSLPIGLL